MSSINHGLSHTHARRLVIKIGSVLLVEEKTGKLYRTWLDAMVDDIAACKERGQEVLIVTSGAIAIGRQPLGISGRSLRLEDKQAAAATGQVRLTQAYQDSFDQHGITVAQVLLTIDDTENRRRYLNARNTLDTLLRLGTVPIINENDTVATQEIRFGDNDRLAAQVAQMTGADTLVLLSDTDGLYTADPSQDTDAKLVPLVTEITPEIQAMAGAAQPGHGTGGMETKLSAARICMAAGCHLVIAPGRKLNPIAALEKGGDCTWFESSAEPRTARKEWIAGGLQPVGAILIDEGAATALQNGKSVLPAGVIGVEGKFHRGDGVSILTVDGEVLGKGICAYSAEDARIIIGCQSDSIEGLLGYRGREELIHRDDLVLGK